MDSTKEARTVKGKRFYYCGDVSGDLIIYPTDGSGKQRSAGEVHISLDKIQLIKSQIMTNREIAMGACRDTPSHGSIGEKLRERHWSPQILSYVVPLLIQVGFCEAFKRGRSYFVRRTE
jgi:hypothetical protein